MTYHTKTGLSPTEEYRLTLLFKQTVGRPRKLDLAWELDNRCEDTFRCGETEAAWSAFLHEQLAVKGNCPC